METGFWVVRPCVHVWHSMTGLLAVGFEFESRWCVLVVASCIQAVETQDMLVFI